MFRLSHLPDRIADTWQLAAQGTTIRRHATPSRGIVRVMIDRENAVDVAGTNARAAAGHCTIIAERAAPTFSSTGPTPAANATLSSRIRAAFDPAGILNPGLAPDAPRSPMVQHTDA